tara:strand:- start:138 stop:746 length:609 start_codon:yes stop_codon:yes gene_type:complete
MNIDEGYIKFSFDLVNKDLPDSVQWEELNIVREKLFQSGLIGEYQNGIGFGNVSVRTKKFEFLITGSSTGGIESLQNKDFCLVTAFDLTKNHVQALGRINPSSESMSHGAIYSTNQSIAAVIHIHSPKIYQAMLSQKETPRTAKDIAYGTPQMGIAISKLVRSGKVPFGFFATEGHDEGIFAYGRSIDEAMTQTNQLTRKFS